MKVAFVGVFCASLQHTGKRGELPLHARRKGDAGTSRMGKEKREITYRFPPYTYTQNPEEFAHLKDPSKIAAAMWRDYVDNSGQMDPKLVRPRRHYPAHHYKRELKQKIGMQRKEARLQKILHASTTPNRRDDFSNLDPEHRPRILDAFERLDAWRKASRARHQRKESLGPAQTNGSIPEDCYEPYQEIPNQLAGDSDDDGADACETGDDTRLSMLDAIDEMTRTHGADDATHGRNRRARTFNERERNDVDMGSIGYHAETNDEDGLNRL